MMAHQVKYIIGKKDLQLFFSLTFLPFSLFPFGYLRGKSITWPLFLARAGKPRPYLDIRALFVKVEGSGEVPSPANDEH